MPKISSPFAVYDFPSLSYSLAMTLYEFYVSFPDGDTREIDSPLSMADLFDVNAVPLPLPLPSNRMLAYRISSRRTHEERGIVTTRYFLEQLSSDDLLAYL